MFACDYFGRRWTAFVSSMAAAISMFLCPFVLGKYQYIILILFLFVERLLIDEFHCRGRSAVGGDIHGGEVFGGSCRQYHAADGDGGGADSDQGTEQLHPDHSWQFAYTCFLLHCSFGNLTTQSKYHE